MDRLTLTPQELDYLRSQRLGRLATVDGRGAPQLIRITPDRIASWGLEPGTSYHMTIRRAQN